MSNPDWGLKIFVKIRQGVKMIKPTHHPILWRNEVLVSKQRIETIMIMDYWRRSCCFARWELIRDEEIRARMGIVQTVVEKYYFAIVI